MPSILHAGKDIENRTWKTNMRGIIAVHASKSMSRQYYDWAIKEIRKVAPKAKVPSYETMARGGIVGLAEIVGCEKRTKSKWHMPKHYGFVLARPCALPKSINCTGRLGFWDVPDNVGRRISRHLK